MNRRNAGVFVFGVVLVAGVGFTMVACSGAAEDGAPSAGVGTADEAIVRATAQGGRDEAVLLYITVQNADRTLRTRTCSGSYFAPRVVLTAAHCLDNVFLDQVFVYWGDNFAQDFSQLTGPGSQLVPPAPGQPSFWAKADSFEHHPAWDPLLFHPDMAVVYLDRKPPFDPLPLARFRLDDSWINKVATITGWGADAAPTPVTGTGSRVERTGTTHILGSPTVADFHPEDPNPGLLQAAIRRNVLKTDGRAPNSSACFGDSGGPLLVSRFGQTYIAGISYFTGLSCEDYNLFTRLDPFLPFLDQAYKRGGQETLIPALECVTPNASGSLTAYFGYANKNGVGLNVPFGSKNQLALDVPSSRPAHFVPGAHHFVFGVDFTSTQTVRYVLAPENSPRTTLLVDTRSRRCGAADVDGVECANACRASQRSGCGALSSFEDCVGTCLGNTAFVREIAPECLPAASAFNQCTAGVPPGTAQWICDPDIGPMAPACDPQLAAFSSCLGF